MNSDVTDTVPDRWGGTAASNFDHLFYRFAVAVAGLGSPIDNYAETLKVAAATMSKARQLLQDTKQYCASNGLYLKPDLTVESWYQLSPDAGIAKQTGQAMLDAAVRTAEQARQQIRAANAKLEQDAVQVERELLEIASAMSVGAGRRGGRGRKSGRMPGPRSDYESGLRYGPEGRIKLPAKNAGTWSGVPGDSRFTPNRPGDFGLREGDSILFKDGVPDLSEHAVPPEWMPDGGSSALDGLPLRGRKGNPTPSDNSLGDAVLAERFGWTPDQVTQWRKDNDHLYHHYSDNELQLVPGRVHRPLNHQGGASEAER